MKLTKNIIPLCFVRKISCDFDQLKVIGRTNTILSKGNKKTPN